MEIIALITYKNARVAEVIYRSGMHVEVRVEEEFQEATVHFKLVSSPNEALSGPWEVALDSYFNEGCFDSKDAVFPGEMRRVGSARDHKSLFSQAVLALSKDLAPYGYQIGIQYT